MIEKRINRQKMVNQPLYIEGSFQNYINESLHNSEKIDYSRAVFAMLTIYLGAYKLQNLQIIAIQYSGDRKSEIVEKFFSENFIRNIKISNGSIIVECFDGVYLSVLIFDGEYLDIFRGKSNIFPF